jgi:hypothetical protein
LSPMLTSIYSANAQYATTIIIIEVNCWPYGRNGSPADLSLGQWDLGQEQCYFLLSARVICSQLLSAHSRVRTEYGVVTPVQAVLQGTHTHDATTWWLGVIDLPRLFPSRMFAYHFFPSFLLTWFLASPSSFTTLACVAHISLH